MSGQTPSQTVGPYFAYGLVPEQYGFDFRSAFPHTLQAATDPGDGVTIGGQVFDGDGQAIHDALLEVWIDADENRPAFCRFGTGTDPLCRYSFEVPASLLAATAAAIGSTERDAPHVNMLVMARGMLLQVVTRLYFPDQEEANAADPTLRGVPEPRRRTLIARKTGPSHYTFDIHLQGAAETVFFSL